MRIYQYAGEQDLAELVNKLYVNERPGLTIASIGKRLQQSNVHLSLDQAPLADHVPDGSRILLPYVEGTRYTDATSPLGPQIIDALPTDIMVNAIAKSIDEFHVVHGTKLTEMLDRVHDLIDAAPAGFGPELEGVAESIKYNMHRNDGDRDVLMEAVTHARDVLERQRDLIKSRP